MRFLYILAKDSVENTAKEDTVNLILKRKLMCKEGMLLIPSHIYGLVSNRAEIQAQGCLIPMLTLFICQAIEKSS